MAEHCKATGSASTSSTPRCETSSGSPGFIPVEALAGHVSCGLCSGPVASSLLLSCSHLFCGDCVFRHLTQEKPCCPTCNMDLRAVPVRCLAMDKVAASIVPSLTAEQQQQYAKRKQDGQCAADKVNKMFWYLAPTALPSPTGPPALPLQAAANPMASSCMPLSAAATADFAGSGLSQLSLDPKTSNSLQGMTAALHSNQQQQQQFVAPLMQLGCMPGAAAAAAMPPHLQGVAGAAPLLQLAVAAQQMAHAQQMAQMQQLAQVQQQLSAASLNPACRPLQHAGAAAGAGALPGYMGGCGDASAYLGLASQPPLSVPGYQDLQQLSSMIGSMCQV